LKSALRKIKLTLGKISNYGDIDFSALAVSWKKNIIALESETDFDSEQANVYFEKKGVITDENFASSDKVFMTFCVPFLAFAFKQSLFFLFCILLRCHNLHKQI
jgi:hypothetical protein